MKIIQLIPALAIFTLFLTNCGNNDEKAVDKTSEKIAEKILENATGNKADIDINTEGDKGSVTIKGDNGEEVTISSNGNEIPDDFPSDIYLTEGETVSVGTVKSGEGSIITVVKNYDGDMEKAAAEILKEMKANGWKSDMNMTTSEGGMQMFSKDNNSVTITFGKDKQQTQISYVVTVSKK